MTKPVENALESPAPFGTEPRRSNTPIYILGVLYGIWFCVLIWMAFFYHPAAH